jgi:hypothetical protein
MQRFIEPPQNLFNLQGSLPTGAPNTTKHINGVAQDAPRSSQTGERGVLELAFDLAFEFAFELVRHL